MFKTRKDVERYLTERLGAQLRGGFYHVPRRIVAKHGQFAIAEAGQFQIMRHVPTNTFFAALV